MCDVSGYSENVMYLQTSCTALLIQSFKSQKKSAAYKLVVGIFSKRQNLTPLPDLVNPNEKLVEMESMFRRGSYDNQLEQDQMNV